MEISDMKKLLRINTLIIFVEVSVLQSVICRESDVPITSRHLHMPSSPPRNRIAGTGGNRYAVLAAAFANDAAPAGRPDVSRLALSAIIPEIEREIRRESSPDSKIRKAALEIVSTALTKSSILMRTKEHQMGVPKRLLVSESLEIEPDRSGRVVSSGIEWAWYLNTFLGEFLLYPDKNPPYVRFRLSLHLTICTTNAAAETKFLQVVIRPNRWFFLVEGGGDQQDATVAPPNAPLCGCGCGVDAACICEVKKPRRHQ